MNMGSLAGVVVFKKFKIMHAYFSASFDRAIKFIIEIFVGDSSVIPNSSHQFHMEITLWFNDPSMMTKIYSASINMRKASICGI